MLPKQNILLSGGPPRGQLERLLRHDNATVAWYQPPTVDQIGASDVLTCSAWNNWGYASAGSGGSLLQATAGNRPLLPSTDYVPHLWFSGVTGNHVSTPDAVPISTVVTGAVFVFEMDLAHDLWAGAGDKYLAAQYGAAGNKSWYVDITGGAMGHGFSVDGTAVSTGNSTSNLASFLGLANGQRIKLRWSRTAATGVVQYHYSVDSGTTWVKLGNDVASTAGALFHSTAAFTVASLGSGGAGTASSGKIYRAGIAASLGGVPVSEMIAADAPETSTNGATFVSSATGETWTVVNTGSKPAMICRSPMMLGDGAASFMQTGALAINAPYTIISVEKAISWTSGDVSFDGRTANSFAAQQITGSPQMRIHDGSADSATISPVLGSWNIITASQAADGTLSLQLNQGTPVTATMSATALAGLTEFSDGAGASFGNYLKKEKIVLSEVPSASKLQRIHSLLRQLHGTT